MIKAVFIDMDNTLLRTQQLYEDAHAQLAALVRARTGVDADAIITETRRCEIELFPIYGYGREMLPSAFEESLLHFVPDATAADIATVRDYANNVYRREAEVKAGAEDAIRTLSAHVPVYLLTAGDQEVQESRVAKLPFRDRFREIYIVSEKDAAVYTKLLAKHRINPEDAVMIGDSLKSDIVSSVAAGMSAIYIADQNWTAREMTGQKLPTERVTELKDLTEAVAFLLPQILPAADVSAPKQRPPRAPGF
jgi:putative hydrolase of the HAD superfamily